MTDQSSRLDRPRFVRLLTGWFQRAQRDLAWRRPENARDPYRVLVSEVMLQQTTVAAVGPFYDRFLDRFPTLESLAAAPLDEVLTLWAGLGYYQRARSLHQCARTIMERHHGVFPCDLPEVLALPGVGRYTAGAVTSIAFDTAAPIIDANVARVLARVFRLEGDLKSPTNQRRLWHEAEQIVNACSAGSDGDAGSGGDGGCRPSVLNPALMELGALICTPRDPQCTRCPVERLCLARQAGMEKELPHATARAAIVQLHDVCAFASRRDGAGPEEVLVRQRPHDARTWWRGLWELPRTTVAAGETTEDALRRLMDREMGLAIQVGRHLKRLRHGVTHHQITLDCWEVEIAEPLAVAKPLAVTDQSNGAPAARWSTYAGLQALAMPSTMRRLLTWLAAQQAAPRQLTLGE